MHKNLTREQALVFSFIDGIRQIDKILVFGKVLSPKNIIYTISRILNNRFCVFLSRKEMFVPLLKKSYTISVNKHIIQIRRLINRAKKKKLSKYVGTSISNQSILNALKNINITPVSQINYMKAGINLEGYEHILSFRLQIFTNHEDIIKVPGSKTIIHNQTQFIIFFTG